MLGSLLCGARLLEVTERSPVHVIAQYAGSQRDTRPRLVFDRGVLNVENPYVLDCDSGETVHFSAIAGCHVTDVFSTEADFFVVFEGKISLRISLREEDFIGPEAATYKASTGEVVHVSSGRNT